jgi:uroporphyrinogen-III decarboxylase
MPRDGFYFDMPALTASVPDWRPPSLKEIRREHVLGSEELEHIQACAERLRASTDKALMLGAWDTTGLPWTGSIPDFLMLLLTDKPYVKDLFAVRTEVAMENLERLNRDLGSSIDIIGMEGNDFGAQNSELISPELLEELFIPFFREQNAWVHRNTQWKTWFHSCGSILRILPMLIGAGVDIINPVQTSAAGMDPALLKQRFGGRIVFWGGGVDTQRTLPFASPEEVAAQVRERIRVFAPGGGFVFNPIHNIQQGTPPENIAAAYDTARSAGVYPIR